MNKLIRVAMLSLVAVAFASASVPVKTVKPMSPQAGPIAGCNPWFQKCNGVNTAYRK